MKKKNRKKRPSNKINPQTSKTPNIDRQNLPDSIVNKKPVWKMGMLDFDGPWGWNKIKGLPAFLSIQKKIKKFEEMKWSEIEGKNNHFIKKEKISDEAKKRLTQIKLDDHETLFSFKITSVIRLWGIRDNEALNILWYDPEHTVCPSMKKHT